MKFTRSTYPDYPGVNGDPCWTLEGKYLWVDADWNPRFPFGVCFGFAVGKQQGTHKIHPYSLCLDLNAPLGEPNRLYLNGRRWHVILGLLTTRKDVFWSDESGDWFKEVRTWPRVVRCSRYKYHRDEEGDWERDDKPAPLHWGWLTIERRE